MNQATAAAILIAVAVVSHSGCAETPSRDEPSASAAPTPSTVAPRATAPPTAERTRPPAAGGMGILASVPKAHAVVAGVISTPEKVDLQGWAASLRVDQVLLGDVRLGDTLRIAWEELSPSRRVRFDDGGRILVVLDPLPTQSLWRTRFPTADAAHPVFVIAAASEAFVRDPDGGTLNELQHYLAMAPEAREGTPGATKLAALVGSPQPGLAAEALGLLETRPTLVAKLGPDGAAVLLRAARDPQRDPAVRGRALGLAAQHQLAGTRETALALAEPASTIRADAYRALAALPDGLSTERAHGLLDDSSPDLRVVGIELAADPALRERLVQLARRDDSAAVRLAAGQALLSRHGAGAIAQVIPLLDDTDASVRAGIGRRIGELGSPAVEPLRTVVDSGSETAALAAILGLSRAGREGGREIVEIASSHQSEKVRGFAKLALGRAPGHEH